MNCTKAQSLLSEYMDSALSARNTWEVEKHLSECHACKRLLKEMRQAVALLADAPRFEVSNEFMERLQTRLANLQPGPRRRPWLSGLPSLFRPRALSIWGAAATACVLAFLLLIPQRREPPALPSDRTEASLLQTAKIQNAALSASNPLEDLAAAHLAAQTEDDPNQLR